MLVHVISIIMIPLLAISLIHLSNESHEMFRQNIELQKELRNYQFDNNMLENEVFRLTQRNLFLEDNIFNYSNLVRQLSIENNRLTYEIEQKESYVFERWTISQTTEIHFDDFWSQIRHRNFQRLDVNYYGYNIKDIKREFRQISADMPQYEADFFDCVDFTIEMQAEMRKRFKGLPIGMLVISNNGKDIHAVNIIVGEDLTVWYAEPQTGMFVLFDEFSKHTKYNRIEFIML